MTNKRWLVVCALSSALFLSGCLTSGRNVIVGKVSAEDVMRQIKFEVLQYNEYAQSHKDDAPLKNACKGKLDLEISSVKIVLTTVTDDKAKTTVGASVPIGTFATASPSLGLSSELKNTQTVSFTIFPTASDSSIAQAPPKDKWEGLPIKASLQQFRESLLRASDQPPCFTLEHPDQKPQDNSYQAAFVVTKSVEPGATLKFLIFSLGASASTQQEASNTITVTFKGTGTSLFSQSFQLK